MSATTVTAIDAELDRVELEHGVSIPFAIESGSRAWGFPSPDSDYDCRFVFVRPIDQQLSPWTARDVIEMPLIGDLDVNGWDLGKALRLLLKGNAVIIEWLRSPIIYRGHTWFRDDLLAFAREFASREMIGRHYLHLGERQRRTYFGDGVSVAQKKIFYALRPAATLRWLRLHQEDTIAPMHFPTLMKESEIPAEVSDEVAELLAKKAVTRELGSAPLSPTIAAFIDTEFDLARPNYQDVVHRPSGEAVAAANVLFRNVVRRLEG